MIGKTGSLISFEAEEGVLGYLLNSFIDVEDKEHALLVLYPELFANPTAEKIFNVIKEQKTFDKIALMEYLGSRKIPIDWIDVENMSEMTTEKEFDSYLKIIEDKCQKRKLWYAADDMIKKLENGEDHHDLALRMMDFLANIGTNYKLKSNEEILESAINDIGSQIIKSGYQVLDMATGGFTRGTVITIGGDSGHMKTTLAIDMAFRMLEEDDKIRIGIFSKEMLSEELMRKIICRQCNLSMQQILTQQFDKTTIRKILMDYEPLRNNRLVLIDPSNFSRVGDIAKIQFAHKFDVWFLDFIQLLDFPMSRGGDPSSAMNASVMQNMKELKSLSVSTKTLGVILSQLKKGVELRRSKIPTVGDLEWSGTIKQLSSYVFLSYYPMKYYNVQTIPGLGVVPKDLYYILGEKTRFSSDLRVPMKVNAEFGKFEEYLKLEQRLKYINYLNLL